MSATFILINCEYTLMCEIRNHVFYRKDIAKTYNLAMRLVENKAIDWKRVNEAIIDRWSKSGLEWIKRMAHSGKCWD